ncbi:hypothetical protein LTR28_006309 [Elasticomyces elasticus]|nr:hypothetical protein LTR28_006309 [Elasticomyces elasticus]
MDNDIVTSSIYPNTIDNQRQCQKRSCSTFTGGHPKHTIEFQQPGKPDEHTKNVSLILKAFDDTYAALHHATI